MKEKIICFSHGLSHQDIEKGKESFQSMNPEDPELDVTALDGSMLDLPVAEVLGGVLFGSGFNTAEALKPSEVDSSPGGHSYRVVVVHAQEREQVLQVMRSFKAVLPDPQNIIFAVITQTALNWTFKDYFGHLGQEHEQMKARRAKTEKIGDSE